MSGNANANADSLRETKSRPSSRGEAASSQRVSGGGAGLSSECLGEPAIRLSGELDDAMLGRFLEQLSEVPDDAQLVPVEVHTPGGAADVARRIVLELQLARRRLRGRLVFVGKTQVYSGGVTVMSGFPREDRYLTGDAVLLIHCRQLEQTIEISGPMRANLPKIDAARQQIEIAMRLEDENFRRLIEGSDIGLEEITGRALHNWYLGAEEAHCRGLVAGVLDLA